MPLDRPALAALFVLLAGPAAATPPGPVQHPSYPIPALGESTAPAPVQVDGFLDEPVWASARVIELRVETQPGENVPAPVATECLLIHDTANLYVAFRAHDPEPKRIWARLTDRDKAWDDDIVGVILDPFNDERRGFEFFVNPLGVQMDAFLDDLTGDDDISWDAIWASAGRLTDTGYVVEMAIPFTSLRFPQREGTQVWGIDALRFYPRDKRHRLASQPRDRNLSCHLCQVSKLEGFAGIDPGRNLELTPTLTSTQAESRPAVPGAEFRSSASDTELGATLRWGVTPNLSAAATLNPDFSQVEADAAQLAINEQFALFFPEKRPFFLEGADFFNLRIPVVFTRNVADPDWGVKLTGKLGAHAFGVFSAEDAVTNLLIPGAESSDTRSLDQTSTATVARYRRDLSRTSTVGVIATDRRGGDYQSSLVGVDALLRLADSDTLRLQGMVSRTRYPTALAEELEQPTGDFEDWAGYVGYNHNSRNWELYARWERFGEDFRADLGFVPQVDKTFLLGGARRKWYPKGGSRFSEVSWGADWNLTETIDGELIEDEWETWVQANGPWQSFLLAGLGTREFAFAGKRFDQDFYYVFGEASPSRNLSLQLEANTGDAVDFANVQKAKRLNVEPSFQVRLGRHLEAAVRHELRRLDVEGGRLFTANLTDLRLFYQLNLRTFVRAIVQYADIERRPDLYSFEVEPRSQDLFTQLLFSYKLNPQTVLFLGYSDVALGNEQLDLLRTDRSLFLKVGYAWAL